MATNAKIFKRSCDKPRNTFIKTRLSNPQLNPNRRPITAPDNQEEVLKFNIIPKEEKAKMGLVIPPRVNGCPRTINTQPPPVKRQTIIVSKTTMKQVTTPTIKPRAIELYDEDVPTTGNYYTEDEILETLDPDYRPTRQYFSEDDPFATEPEYITAEDGSTEEAFMKLLDATPRNALNEELAKAEEPIVTHTIDNADGDNLLRYLFRLYKITGMTEDEFVCMGYQLSDTIDNSTYYPNIAHILCGAHDIVWLKVLSSLSVSYGMNFCVISLTDGLILIITGNPNMPDHLPIGIDRFSDDADVISVPATSWAIQYLTGNGVILNDKPQPFIKAFGYTCFDLHLFDPSTGQKYKHTKAQIELQRDIASDMKVYDHTVRAFCGMETLNDTLTVDYNKTNACNQMTDATNKLLLSDNNGITEGIKQVHANAANNVFKIKNRVINGNKRVQVEAGKPQRPVKKTYIKPCHPQLLLEKNVSHRSILSKYPALFRLLTARAPYQRLIYNHSVPIALLEFNDSFLLYETVYLNRRCLGLICTLVLPYLPPSLTYPSCFLPLKHMIPGKFVCPQDWKYNDYITNVVDERFMVNDNGKSMSVMATEFLNGIKLYDSFSRSIFSCGLVAREIYEDANVTENIELLTATSRGKKKDLYYELLNQELQFHTNDRFTVPIAKRNDVTFITDMHAVLRVPDLYYSKVNYSAKMSSWFTHSSLLGGLFPSYTDDGDTKISSYMAYDCEQCSGKLQMDTFTTINPVVFAGYKISTPCGITVSEQCGNLQSHACLMRGLQWNATALFYATLTTRPVYDQAFDDEISEAINELQARGVRKARVRPEILPLGGEINHAHPEIVEFKKTYEIIIQQEMAQEW